MNDFFSSILTSLSQGFPQVFRTLEGGRGGGISQYMEGAWGGLKVMSKNTCEGVHLIVKLPSISLQTCKFSKMNFFTQIFQGF